MTTIQDRRRETENAIDRLTAQREGCIANLIRYDARLKLARRKLERIKRAAIKALEKDTMQRQSRSAKTVSAEITNVPVAELPIADDLAIPDFLQRKRDGERKDKETADKIRAEQAERKTLKARGRIATMKAKQSGETRRMPLTGRAALEAIRQT